MWLLLALSCFAVNGACIQILYGLSLQIMIRQQDIAQSSGKLTTYKSLNYNSVVYWFPTAQKPPLSHPI